MSLLNFEFVFNKQPSEKELVGINFSRRIPKTVIVSSYDIRLFKYDQESWSSTTEISISNPAIYRDKSIVCFVDGGYADTNYKVSIVVTLSDGQKKEDDILIVVKEK